MKFFLTPQPDFDILRAMVTIRLEVYTIDIGRMSPRPGADLYALI